jgi:two-component system nitrogen regulation response regulator NtrX
MKIIISDDDHSIRKSIALTLIGEPYQLIESGDLSDTYDKLLTERPDLLLLDVHFKTGTSLSLLKKMAEEHLRIPVIVLSGAASAGEAAEAIKYGVFDYLEKPISSERLRLTIQRCLENARLKESLHSITVQSNRKSEILGDSNSTQKIRYMVDQYARKDIKVLLTGETGTGKEVIAHSIWQKSDRADRPFIIVNCAAIPENLIESELFGHKKGAFTGAIHDQIGKIEMAHRGTLFLDEVGDLSFGAQTKLLRFLETGEIQKLGTSQSKTSDVRLICATSRDLEMEIERKHFRLDLFYRLNVVRIHLPPLRERVEDIPLLFSNFVRSFCTKFNEEEKLIEPEVFETLKNYVWTGNIRELRNVAERVVVISDRRIKKEHLNQILEFHSKRTVTPQSQDQDLLSLKDFKNKSEKDYICSVLKKAKGSVTLAAQWLKIDRTYLYQKMTHHQINRDSIC